MTMRRYSAPRSKTDEDEDGNMADRVTPRACGRSQGGQEGTLSRSHSVLGTARPTVYPALPATPPGPRRARLRGPARVPGSPEFDVRTVPSL